MLGLDRAIRAPDLRAEKRDCHSSQCQWLGTPLGPGCSDQCRCPAIEWKDQREQSSGFVPTRCLQALETAWPEGLLPAVFQAFSIPSACLKIIFSSAD